MNWREHIVIDPTILTGKPVVKGTRLAVEFVIDLLAHDWTESEILQNYPGLTHEDIQACLGYASDLLKTERVYPFEIDEESLSDEEITGIEEGLEDIKAGRVYSEKEVKKILGIDS